MDLQSNISHEQPLVTIYCLVYNHAKFLHACLDGFVSQITNFKIKILIHDDASTDGSAEIIKEYVKKHPHIQWEPFYRTENLYSQNKPVGEAILPLVQSKYLAWCEGDDYWTDPQKLQKQVDFLEAHPEYSTCVNKARMVWEKGEQSNEIIPPTDCYDGSDSVELAKFINEGNHFATCSIVYRWCFNRDDYKFEEKYPIDVFPGDMMLHMMHLSRGKVKILPDIMSVYRKHSGGVWYNANNEDAFYAQNAYKLVNFYVQAQKLINYDFSARYQQMLDNCLMACLVTGNGKSLSELFAHFPEDCKAVVEPFTHKKWSNKDYQWQQKLASIPIGRFVLGKLQRLKRRVLGK